jgi:hypothetical protein
MIDWLRIPNGENPADMLRWVRKIDVLSIPAGGLLALLLRSEGLGVWWLGFGLTLTGLVGLATIGPSIRKAERRGPLDPATRPQRRRRARRAMVAWWAVFICAVVAISIAAGSIGFGVYMAVIMLVALALSIWWMRRRECQGGAGPHRDGSA